MGQKTHPIGFRLGVIRGWSSKWYSEKDYPRWLHEDLRLKAFVKEKLGHAGVASVEVERAANKVKINIYTARPGIVIGKRSAGVETWKKDVQALTSNEVFLNIQEVRKAETNAQLVAENVATQLERRVAFRRAMKKAVQTAMKFGAKGIRLACSGRLGGAEMARYEWYHEGRVPPNAKDDSPCSLPRQSDGASSRRARCAASPSAPRSSRPPSTICWPSSA